MWVPPSRASFGKVGSIMKRLRVPIDRHADAAHVAFRRMKTLGPCNV